MNRNLMISALRQGQNGNQILAILDALVGADDVNADVAGGYADAAQDAGFVYMPTIAQNVPTLEEIAF